jgi:hypothetical protein
MSTRASLVLLTAHRRLLAVVFVVLLFHRATSFRLEFSKSNPRRLPLYRLCGPLLPYVSRGHGSFTRHDPIVAKRVRSQSCPSDVVWRPNVLCLAMGAVKSNGQEGHCVYVCRKLSKEHLDAVCALDKASYGEKVGIVTACLHASVQATRGVTGALTSCKNHTPHSPL